MERAVGRRGEADCSTLRGCGCRLNQELRLLQRLARRESRGTVDAVESQVDGRHDCGIGGGDGSVDDAN